jgi:hypothetical protein
MRNGYGAQQFVHLEPRPCNSGQHRSVVIAAKWSKTMMHKGSFVQRQNL